MSTITTCEYCGELLSQQAQDDYICACESCEKAFKELREASRERMKVEQAELAAKLRSEAPDECPLCKGTGRKS